MKIKEIIKEIEKYCPKELAIDRDAIKIGLQVGDVDNECTGVLTCLDVTMEMINKAVENKCNLIVSHHPFIYDSIQKIDLGLGHNRILCKAINENITVYSAHTNMDRAEKGINHALIKLFDGEYIKTDLESECIFYAKCNEITLKDLAKKVSNKINDKSIKVVGNPNKKINSFAICSGGGGHPEDIKSAKDLGADVYISGDFPHHAYLFAIENDFPVIEYSHYSSEIIVEKLFIDILKNLKINVISGDSKCPYILAEEL